MKILLFTHSSSHSPNNEKKIKCFEELNNNKMLVKAIWAVSYLIRDSEVPSRIVVAHILNLPPLPKEDLFLKEWDPFIMMHYCPCLLCIKGKM